MLNVHNEEGGNRRAGTDVGLEGWRSQLVLTYKCGNILYYSYCQQTPWKEQNQWWIDSTNKFYQCSQSDKASSFVPQSSIIIQQDFTAMPYHAQRCFVLNATKQTFPKYTQNKIEAVNVMSEW